MPGPRCRSRVKLDGDESRKGSRGIRNDCVGGPHEQWCGRRPEYMYDDQRPSAASASAAPPVSIILTKSAPRVNLAKGSDGQGPMRVNLNWTARQPSRGLLAEVAAAAVDLDLGCLYELADGTKGVIPAFGNSFGSLDRPPYILLEGDDRSGANLAGENMHVNLARPKQFRRVLVFAMIYQRTPNWAGFRREQGTHLCGGADRERRHDGVGAA
jgi:hypothetical protein